MSTPPPNAAVQLPGVQPRVGPRSLVATGAAGSAALVLALLALPDDVTPTVGVARLSGVALPVGLGLLRLRRRHDDRFALLLVGAGTLWSLTTLAQSTDSVPYSVGRLAAWLVEPAIAALLLSFPSGRLPAARDRRLAGAMVLLVLLLYIPSALFAPFPAPSPWAGCATTTACPSDAFLLTTHAAGFVQAVAQPLREVLSVVLFALVALVLAERANRAPRYLRLALLPVVAVAGLRAVSLAVYFVVRARGDVSGPAHALGWLFVLSLPIITLAFLAGMLAVRLFTADALTVFTASLSSRPHTPEIRASLVRALRDPELEIAFWLDAEQRWVDPAGSPVPDPATTLPRDRALTVVRDGGRPLAAIAHETEAAHDRALVAGMSAYVVTALNNDRLVTRLEDSLRDLALSRARLVSVADEERRRIERDLHDGAQQRLVAVQIKLELLAERRAVDSQADADEIRALEDDVGATLDEVRRFGRGVYPSLLADRGLEDALFAMARTAAIPTTVEAHLSHRPSVDVQATIYFCVAEALQNAGKHAGGASRVRISVSGAGPLRFEVRDDGAGFDPDAVAPGAGLTNMHDRVGALGGRLEIVSSAAGGTTVVGTIPLDAADARTALGIATDPW